MNTPRPLSIRSCWPLWPGHLSMSGQRKLYPKNLNRRNTNGRNLWHYYRGLSPYYVLHNIQLHWVVVTKRNGEFSKKNYRHTVTVDTLLRLFESENSHLIRRYYYSHLEFFFKWFCRATYTNAHRMYSASLLLSSILHHTPTIAATRKLYIERVQI